MLNSLSQIFPQVTPGQAMKRMIRVGALKILEAHCSPTGSDPTGRVSDGFLKVSGLVVQAVVG